MRKCDFDFLIDLLNRQAGWNFSEREYFSIDKKVSNFIREKGFASVEDLITELKSGQKALISQVIEALAFADTHFFRDWDVFQQFEQYVLPLVKETNRNIKKLRILSLGCSSGQEVYSIAIAVNKVLPFSDWQIDIIGTDLSSTAIAKAQRGYYDQFEIQNGLKADLMIDNFTLDGANWKVNDNIKKMVEFRRYNLLDAATFKENFDIIFCRNVLRFFTPAMQEQLCSKIHNMQVPGGILYIGKGEEVRGLTEFYGVVPGMACAYQFKEVKDVSLPSQQDFSVQETANDDTPHFIRPASLANRRPLMSDILRK